MGKVRVVRPARITEKRKLFQENTNDRIAVATTPGLTSGSAIRQKTPRCEQPSIRPASSRSGGTSSKNEIMTQMMDGQPHDEMREDQRSVGIHHPEIPEEDVPGDQVGDAGNDPRDEDHHGQPLLAPVGDGVGRREPHRQAEQRAARRHDEAVPGVEEERVLREDLTVAGQRDAEAHERRWVRRRLDLGLERERDHPVEDEDRRQHEEPGQRIEAGRGEPPAPRAAPHHVVLLRTLIKINDAPMTSAKSATAMDAEYPMLKYENAWLKSRMLMVSDELAGPPWVMTKMMSKVFSASMARNRMATTRAGRSSGSVMCQSACNGVAPSRWAASYGSRGRLARPASAMSMISGVHCQTSTSASA